nr:MAG TPA: hypothetical protein [Caudoviricetes sp.]
MWDVVPTMSNHPRTGLTHSKYAKAPSKEITDHCKSQKPRTASQKLRAKWRKASALLILTKRLTKESNSLHNGINAIEIEKGGFICFQTQ